MYHTIYKITNKVNSKIYVGYHSTNDLNDDYFGSGVALKRAIEKYGKDSFFKEILYVYDNEKLALEKEKEIVNENFVSSDLNYNLTVGGGKPPSAKEWWNEEYSKALSQKMMNNQFKKGKKESEETKKRKKIAFANSDTHAIHTKNKSRETIEKIKMNRKGKALGEKNSMANPIHVEKVRQSKIGLKRMQRDNSIKMARPDSVKAKELLSLGYKFVG
jgi:hypothetical protein